MLPIFQPPSLKSDYGPFTIKVIGLKVFITSNMITNTYIFFLLSKSSLIL